MSKPTMTGGLPVEPTIAAGGKEPAHVAAAVARTAVRSGRWTFVGLTALLLLGYHRVLLDYVRYALQSDLYSYVLLIPFVSAYMAWLHPVRGAGGGGRSVAVALIPLSIGTALLFSRMLLPASGLELSTDDRYALLIGSFICGVLGAAVLSFGPSGARQLAFPLGFLFFLAPMPSFLLGAVNSFLQHASADVSYLFIQLGQIPVLRNGLLLQLPGITLEVAEECSGIRSTVVLLVTSVVASRLFLQRPLHRWLLVAVVLPLAVLRNGLRIFTIAMLCVHVGPEMIDSPVHHRGGPLFFAASLVPLFLLLAWFRRRERRGAANTATVPISRAAP